MKQLNTNTEEMKMSEDYKPTYIHEQHNNNCQQFFGPITNSTFTMPTTSPSQSRKLKATKKKIDYKKKLSVKPKTLKYFTHGNNGLLKKQRRRVDIVYQKWCEWDWIDNQTAPNDFDTFFDGKPRHCNITWNANTTILTILLQELLKQPYITKQTRQSASSMVKEQFGKTPNFDTKRLVDDDNNRIDVSAYLLDIKNPLPLRNGGGDDDEDTTDEGLLAILSGLLRKTKGI